METTTTTRAKSAPNLQRKFAEVAARLRRADVLTRLLGLVLFVVSYAFACAIFEEVVGASRAEWVAVTRWVGFAVFVAISAILFAMTLRCAFRQINPYFIAQKLELCLPDSKNGLINWLDLHDDDIPSAFQKHLSTRAVEQWADADIPAMTRSPRNKILAALLLLPTIGLVVILALNAHAFAPTMGRAFVPFVAPEAEPRTRIKILEPAAGDAEVRSGQAIAFAVKIEGRVPGERGNRAPRLYYRYDPSDDPTALPMQATGDGTWSLAFPAEKVRGGFTYTITAGDATTPEYRIRVRAKAFVTKFTVAYEPRKYRLAKPTTIEYPNESEPTLAVRGLQGTGVELICETSRAVKSADIVLIEDKTPLNLPTRISADGKTFQTKWTLDRSGKLRITFRTTDGDSNSDRDEYEVDVHADASPRVVLTIPGKDVSLPANGILELVGAASDDHGIKALGLHVRAVTGPDKTPLAPKRYRPEKSFRFADGSYPGRVSYRDYLALDDLRNDKGTRIEYSAGTVLEYWLEAVDNADFPNAGGNVGKSAVYRISLTSSAKDSTAHAAKRQEAEDQRKKHEKQQDDQHARDEKQKQQKSDGGGSGAKSLQEEKHALEKEKSETEEKIKQALKDTSDRGSAKSSQPENAQAKPGTSQSADAPAPQSKGDAKDSPADPGANKDEGKGMAFAAARDAGAKPPTGDTTGQAKGIEQQGPPIPNKDKQTANAAPPELQAKGGMPPDAGSPKGQPAPGNPPPGAARQGDGSAKKEGPTLNDIAKWIEQLPDPAGAGNEAGQALAKAARDTDQPPVRKLIHDALKANGRDPKSGIVDKKMPNPFGSSSRSDGIRDDIQVKAANREFARRIGQLQLDDWRKRLTPGKRQNAGLSETDWQRYLKTASAYDALVQKLNAKLLRDALTKDLRGSTATLPGGAVAPTLTGDGAPLDPTLAAPPPELRDAQRRFTSPTK